MLTTEELQRLEEIDDRLGSTGISSSSTAVQDIRFLREVIWKLLAECKDLRVEHHILHGNKHFPFPPEDDEWEAELEWRDADD